ncbi:MAG: hypothetical protein JW818_11335 [Pirellulales bacterium]|nr:hypothetical protein [Pirellulales bacterium]
MTRGFCLFTALLLAVLMASPGMSEPVTYVADDLPLPIPEISLSTIATMTLSDPGVVQQVEVFLDLTHQDVGDLDIFLCKDGRTVQLFNQHGPNTQNLPSVVFDMNAAAPISQATYPLAPGTYQPTAYPESGFSRDLGLFDGLDIAGDWRLWIIDNWPDSEHGQLLQWSLTITAKSRIPGDANEDGKVDEIDARALALHWLQTDEVDWAEGDFNDDGVVDDRDASILAGNWHAGYEGRSTTVPEPDHLAMAAAGILMALQLGWRRRKLIGSI